MNMTATIPLETVLQALSGLSLDNRRWLAEHLVESDKQVKEEKRKSDEELLRELRAIPYELPWTIEEYKKMIRDSRTYLPREHKTLHDEE